MLTIRLENSILMPSTVCLIEFGDADDLTVYFVSGQSKRYSGEDARHIRRYWSVHCQ